MPPKRKQLAQVRKTAGYTQEEFAEELNVDRTTPSRWETGASEPLPYLRPKMARLLGVSLERLNELLWPEEPDELRIDTALASTKEPAQRTPLAPVPTTHADDLQAVATAAAHESLLFADRAAESNVGSDLLEHLRWEISRLAVDYVHAPVHTLFRDLVETRNIIFDLLDKRQRPQHSRELYFLGGTTCLILAHASQNVGNQRAALAQLRTAWTCADGGLLSFRFPDAKQRYYVGSTYGLLGEHEMAEQYAQAAITGYETGLPAERSYGGEALARLDIVNARLSIGDLDGAATAIAPVFALSEDRRIRQLDTAIGRTRGILEQPQFARSRASRELLDGIHHYRDNSQGTPSALPSPR